MSVPGTMTCEDKITQSRLSPVFVRIVIVPHIEAGQETNVGHSQLWHGLGLHRDADVEDRQNTGLRRRRRRDLPDRQRTLEDLDVLAPRPPLVLRMLLDELLRVLLDELPELVLVVREVEAPGLSFK